MDVNIRTNLSSEGNPGTNVPEMSQKWNLLTHLPKYERAKPIQVYYAL